VDDLWIDRANPGVVHGLPILVAPPEDIIWSKSFVCERERFDGTDINHLILARGKQMDDLAHDYPIARYAVAPHGHVAAGGPAAPAAPPVVAPTGTPGGGAS